MNWRKEADELERRIATLERRVELDQPRKKH